MPGPAVRRSRLSPERGEASWPSPHQGRRPVRSQSLCTSPPPWDSGVCARPSGALRWPPRAATTKQHRLGASPAEACPPLFPGQRSQLQVSAGLTPPGGLREVQGPPGSHGSLACRCIPASAFIILQADLIWTNYPCNIPVSKEVPGVKASTGEFGRGITQPAAASQRGRQCCGSSPGCLLATRGVGVTTWCPQEARATPMSAEG